MIGACANTSEGDCLTECQAKITVDEQSRLPATHETR